MISSTNTTDLFPGFDTCTSLNPGKEKIEAEASNTLDKAFSYITSDSQIIAKLSSLFQGMVILNPIIGIGAFGKVAKVRFNVIDSNDLALKLIKREEMLKKKEDSPGKLKTILISKERIAGEGLALQLKHENLINTKAILTLAPDGTPHLNDKIDSTHLDGHHIVGIISEYFKSKELFDIINEELEKGKFLPMQYIQHVTKHVGKALQYLHALNIIYRDLKPENILIDEKNNVKLIDYGLLRDLGRTKDGKTSTIGGTPDFIAPELFLEKAYGKKVDSFAFGILLYDMQTYLFPWNLSPWNTDSQEDPNKYYQLLTQYAESNKSLNQFFNLRMPSSTLGEVALTDLIVRLTHSNPDKRMSIKDAVNHPFFNLSSDEMDRKVS